MQRRGKKLLVLMAAFILILVVLSIANSQEKEKVDEKVYEELQEKGEVNVVVKENEKKGFFIFKEEKEKVYGIKVDEKDLEKLKKNKNVEEISFTPQIRAFMQDSVSIVNATYAWNIIINNTNITGIDETICIIDTAANFSHPDLIGKNKTCVIDCFNKDCVENCSISDDNGHGTHVAGTVAASGGLYGVAKHANLINLRVLDENGDAHPQNGTINIRDAIQWCVENKNNYNISVISMSLGTTALYDDYCDISFASTLTKAINNATFYNISVIAATGNSGSTTGIASPACIENSTSVSSVRKDDVTFNYNRNNITELIATGYSINSTRGYSGGCLTNCQCSGEYMVCSGTSMAVPHVSGAFALLRQYLRLQNPGEPTPEEIQDALNSTGKIINDPGTGLDFSRIDILSAIISLDDKNPEVNLISPEDSYSQFTQNLTFSCYANDPQLSNATLYLWNSSGIYNDAESFNFQEVSGRSEFNITNISRGNYQWNCLAYDKNSNYSFADSNYTFSIDYNNVNLTSPVNNSYANNNQSFNCSSETESSKILSNITFFLWNETDNFYNETKNISGTINSTIFYYNFTMEEKYKWNCLVNNNHSEFSFAASNNTITYDIISPNITLISPENSASYTGSQQITFNFNVSEAVTNCSLLMNGAITSTNYSINHSITQQIIEAINAGSYSWKIQCFDLAGNENQSSSRTLTVNAQQIVSSGGDGGTTQEKTYLVNEEKSLGGYNQELQKNDKIIFYIGAEEHSITTKSLSSDSATFLIESDPIEATFNINEERFFDLTEDNVNDLYLKLNSIVNSKANLTIKTLKQEPEEPVEQPPEETEEEPVEIIAFEDQKESNLNSYQLGLIISIIIILFIIVILMLKPKNENNKIKNFEHSNLGGKFEKIKTKSSGKEKIPFNKRKRRR